MQHVPLEILIVFRLFLVSSRSVNFCNEGGKKTPRIQNNKTSPINLEYYIFIFQDISLKDMQLYYVLSQELLNCDMFCITGYLYHIINGLTCRTVSRKAENSMFLD